MICNKRTLAGIFGVSEETLTEWARRGCPVEARHRGRHGSEYDTAAVFRWRVARVDASTATDLASEKAALARAQRERTQLDIDQRTGRLLVADDVDRVLSAFAYDVMRVLESMPDVLPATLVGLEHGDMHRALHAYQYDARVALVAKWRDKHALLRGSVDAVAPAAPPSPKV